MTELLGTVTAVEPFAEYQGTVYTQLVEIQLSGNFEYWLFDHNMLTGDEYLKDEIGIDVGLIHHPSDWVMDSDSTPGIDPNGGEKSTNHKYTGKVDELVTKNSTNELEVVINIG